MAANVRELGVVRVAKPCGRDWAQMAGDVRARFCADCQLNVYNLSEMTTDEAHQLIREKEGKLCVRFYTRDDGTVLTRDCPVGVKLQRRKLIAAGAGAASLALAALAFAVSASFTDAQSESCATAPAKRPLPMVKDPTVAPDESWIEKRRKQFGLGPPPAPDFRRVTMGAMRIERKTD